MIVHLSTEMAFGGGERQLLYLYRGLSERGIPQMIICATGSKLETYCQKHHYDHFSIKRRGGFSLPYVWQLKNILKNLLKKQSICAIHCHDAHAHMHALLTDVLLLHRVQLPLIISKKVVPSSKKKGFNLFKYHYPSIKKIICVSQASADVCTQWSNPNKIVVLHDTVPLSDYYLPKTHHDFNIGIIGSLIPIKDHPFFLACAQKILDTHHSIYFWIIGEGHLRHELEEEVKTLNIQSNVKFFGFREDIPDLLSQLDILFVTSNNEGLCSTILQAMAAQVPVIARPVGGIPEIIQHQKNGLLADNVDDFVKYALDIYSNPAVGKQLAQTAFSSVKAHDLPVFIDKMLLYYRWTLFD